MLIGLRDKDANALKKTNRARSTNDDEEEEEGRKKTDGLLD